MQRYLQDSLSVDFAKDPLGDIEQDKDSIFDQKTTPQSAFNPLANIDPYITSFVCLLVPRFEEHLLVGDLSDQIPHWMIDVCISFGWKLKFIDIRPGYLHWIMAVSISTYPTKFMKIIRREISSKIFEDFPRFKQKNVSKDFWAPWYFVGIGEVPYSQRVIQTYIKQIRIEQGLQ
jgi:REP element-mobilizing transposase RayT